MRYVIRHPDKGYFTEMKVSETKAVTLNGQVIGYESQYRPAFDAFMPTQAAQYDTEKDAQSAMASNPDQHGGVIAFDSCIVEPSTVESST